MALNLIPRDLGPVAGNTISYCIYLVKLNLRLELSSSSGKFNPNKSKSYMLMFYFLTFCRKTK